MRLKVHGAAGHSRRVDGVIDTGFNQWLTLPPTVISALGLPLQRRGTGLLADGTECSFNVYKAVVIWDRRRRHIPVYETDSTPLVGMALLDGYELNAKFRVGGKVTIKKLGRRRRG